MDRYVANLYVRPPTPQILDFGARFWILGILGILDFGSWGFRILDFGDFGFWISGILDFGSWGFWILGPKSKIQNPPIQNPKSKLFWPFLGILDFGPLCSKSLCGPKFRGFWILDLGDLGDFGFWILDSADFGFWGFGILDLGDFGFLDFGDFGFWILDLYVANLYVRPPTPQIWGILGILDFGVWGFWILDFVTNFGCYIRKEDCARRTGSADLFFCISQC